MQYNLMKIVCILLKYLYCYLNREYLHEHDKNRTKAISTHNFGSRYISTWTYYEGGQPDTGEMFIIRPVNILNWYWRLSEIASRVGVRINRLRCLFMSFVKQVSIVHNVIKHMCFLIWGVISSILIIPRFRDIFPDLLFKKNHRVICIADHLAPSTGIILSASS